MVMSARASRLASNAEAADWLDRTATVLTINSHSLNESTAEFDRLKTLNDQLMAESWLERVRTTQC